MIRAISIRARLLFGFGALLLLGSTTASVAALRLRDLDRAVADLTVRRWRNAMAINALHDAVSDAARAKLSLFVLHGPDADRATSDVADARKRIDAAYARMDSIFTDAREIAAIKAIKANRKVHAAAFDSSAKLWKAGQDTAAGAYVSSAVLPTLKTYLASIDTLQATQDAAVAASGTAARAEADTGLRVVVALGIVALFAGVVLAWVLSRSITRPLSEIVKRAEQVRRDALEPIGAAAAAMASGDTTRAVQVELPLLADRSRDEVAQLAAALDGIITETQRTCGAFDDARGSVSRLVREAETLSVAAQEGRLAVRAPAEQFLGSYRDVIVGINRTLDAMLAPVQDAAATLALIADGDLTARVQGTYAGDHTRVTSAVNATAERLADAITLVRESAERVSTASSQIAAGGASVAEGSSTQAASFEEIASGLTELASTTRENASRAQDASQRADSARKVTAEGVERVHTLSSAVERIKRASDDAAKIVKTIDEIAFQTNLLALNAAVEAARAGDAGRGFAVVAEEVRALALRSATASRQTSELISQVEGSARQGVSISGDVLSAFGAVDRAVDAVREVIAELAASSDEQARGVHQIAGAMDEASSVTQQTASAAEESATASGELAGEASRMRELTTQFVLDRADIAPAWAMDDDEEYEDETPAPVAARRDRERGPRSAKRRAQAQRAERRARSGSTRVA